VAQVDAGPMPLVADGIDPNPTAKASSSCVHEPRLAAISSVPRSPIGPYLVKLFAASDAAKSPSLGRKLRVFYSAYTIKLEGASGHAFAGTMETHCPTSYDN